MCALSFRVGMSLWIQAPSGLSSCCLLYLRAGRKRWTTWGAPTTSITTTALHSGNGLPTCTPELIFLSLTTSLIWHKARTEINSSYQSILFSKNLWYWFTMATFVTSSFLNKGCELRSWERQSAATNPPRSTPCFPSQAPHQWGPGEWTSGFQGDGQCERGNKTKQKHRHT